MGKKGEIGGVGEPCCLICPFPLFPRGPGGGLYSGRVPRGCHSPGISHGLGSALLGVSPKASPKWGSQEGDTFTDHSCKTPSHSRGPWGGFGNSGCPAPCPGLVTRSR